MSDVNQVMDDIKKAIPREFFQTVIKSLVRFRTKKQFKHLTDSEFFDLVGEVFKLDPNFFMKYVYKPFRKKIKAMVGGTKLLKEMDKYIIQKFCFYEGEHILYECEGNISNTELGRRDKSGKYKANSSLALTVKVGGAQLIFTNYRIIAQGKLKAVGGQNLNLWVWAPKLFWLSGGGGGAERKESKKRFVESSPVYGYNFQIENHFSLTKVIKLFRSVMYNIMIEDRICRIAIKPDYSVHLDKIFDILRKDAGQVINLIYEMYKVEIVEENKKKAIVGILEGLFSSEEFEPLSDSEFLDIVGETFKLDSEFFMKAVYPKMMSWTFSSFVRVKEEIISLVDRSSKEDGLS